MCYFCLLVFLYGGIKMTVNQYNHYPLEATIGSGLRCPHNFGIVISGGAVVGQNVTIMHQVAIGTDETGDKNLPLLEMMCLLGRVQKLLEDAILEMA